MGRGVLLGWCLVGLLAVGPTRGYFGPFEVPEEEPPPALKPPDGAWPTKRILVPATDWEHPKHVGLSRPEWIKEYTEASIYTYQNRHPSQPHFAHRSKAGLENMPYMRFIVDYYYNLPEYIVFIHADVAKHNPVWMLWLECLRTDKIVPWVSLSPEFVKRDSEGSPNVGVGIVWKVTTGKWFNLTNHKHRVRSFYCCEQYIVHKSTILRHKREMYVNLYNLLKANMVPARIFEYSMHTFIFGAHLEMRPFHPCQNFKCWCPTCSSLQVGKVFTYTKTNAPRSRFYKRFWGISYLLFTSRQRKTCATPKQSHQLCSLVHRSESLPDIQKCPEEPPPKRNRPSNSSAMPHPHHAHPHHRGGHHNRKPQKQAAPPGDAFF